MRKTKTEWDECKFPFPREGQKCGWGFNDLNCVTPCLNDCDLKALRDGRQYLH